MKKTLQLSLGLLFLSAMLTSTASAQAPIPNGNFENWSGNTPVGWTTDNAGPNTPITMTTDAHSGNSALRGAVTSLGVPPIVTTGSADTKGKVPYTDHPGVFQGYYKYATTTNDSLHVIVVFTRQGQGIGGSIFSSAANVSNYTQFSVPIFWNSANAPDSMSIAISIISATGIAHAGSTFYIDDLAFANSNGVSTGEATAFALEQNYPNPFNPSTTIRYTLTESSQTVLAVYDVMGSLVSTLVNGRQVAGEHVMTFDASSLASGVYFYRLTSGGHTVQHSMQLIK